MDLLKKLTEAFGMPGWEGEIRRCICAELEGLASGVRIDRMGNIIADINPGCGGRHIALATHMDETGLMVKSIDAGGFLRFTAWGTDKRVLPGKLVIVGEKKVPGVIGIKPVHSLKPEEKGKFLETAQLYIDIGAASKEEAARLVSPGEYVGLEAPFTRMGDGLVSARGLDARAGCAAIIEALRDGACTRGRRITAVFCAQKETGLRGSAVAANQVAADMIVSLDGMDAAPDGAEARRRGLPELGAGPALVLKDKSALYPRDAFLEVRAAAERRGIPWQLLSAGEEKSDSGSFQQARGGARVVGVGIPVRYARTSAAMMRLSDYENTISLLKSYLAQE